MCGLVAIISKTKYGFTFKDSQLFEQMLYADAVRGEDSTGVFGVNKYGNLKMIKSAKTSADFIRTKAFSDFSKGIFGDYRVVVGHNRASTKGTIIDENAHPFIEDHICLVHNGTLNSHKELADTVVDSHAIAVSIAKEGYKETIPKINGAYALIWYDAKEKKLRVARNNQRPLWIIQMKDIDIIASEPDMITWLHRRVYGNASEAPKFFAVESLYSWDLTNLEDGLTTEDIPAKKAMSVLHTVPQTLPAVTKQVGGGVNYYRNSTGNKFVAGQKIIFEHTSNSIVGDSVTFHGHLIDDHSIQVRATCSIKGYTKEQLENLLDYSEFLVGTYIGYSKPRDKTTIFLNDADIVQTYTSCNGHVVTLQQIQNAGHCCDDCGTIIEPDDDDSMFWARVKGGEIKRMLCPTCVAKHPKLNELIKEQDTCTQSESSSSVINVDLDQFTTLQEAYGL